MSILEGSIIIGDPGDGRGLRTNQVNSLIAQYIANHPVVNPDSVIPLAYERWAGGVVENGNSYEIDMNVSDVGFTVDGIDGLDLFVVGSIFIDGGGGIIDVFRASDRVASKTVHNRQTIQAIGKLDRNAAGQYAAGALKARFTASSSTTVIGMRLSLVAYPGFGAGDVAGNTQHALANTTRLDHLSLNLLHDLRPGDETPEWGEVASGFMGLAAKGTSGSFALSDAVSQTYTRRLGRSNYGFSGKFINVRLPRNSNTSQYRVRRYHDFDDGRTPYADYQPISEFYVLGFSGNFDYYQSHSFVPDWVTYQLENASAGTHIGTTSYEGNVLQAKVLEALGLPTDLSAVAEQIIQVKADGTGFEFQE